MVAIEGYGDVAMHSVSQHIYIQSPTARAKRTWYLLQAPSPDYQPYHHPFMWVADFVKHAIDYISEHEGVSLNSFKSNFYHWIQQQHGPEEAFQSWLSEFGKTDFRQVVIAHASFLYKEAWDVFDGVLNDPLWTDIPYPPISGTDAIRPEIRGCGKTLVTPYVLKSFRRITQLASFFEAYTPNRRVAEAWRLRQQALGFVNAEDAPHLTHGEPILEQNIKRNDFVVIRPDEETIWKDGSQVWYAYIQDIRKDCHGKYYEVIWLYPPSATTLAGGTYPYQNELFFSTHCNCDEALLRDHDIIGKINVYWYRSGMDPERMAGESFHYFIRQKYDTQNHCFTTLHDLDFACPCFTRQAPFEEFVSKFSIGDTCLVPFTRKWLPSKTPPDEYTASDTISDSMEPVVLDKFLPQSGTVLVRRLLRRGVHFHDACARPNELVWTEEFLEISPEVFGPRCSIRFFQEDDKIPAPYNRNGTGNAWIITTRVGQTGQLEGLFPPFPTGLNQGVGNAADLPHPPMVGLDAFAGGGNFGRGLEDGAAVQFRYAIDCAKNAVLTYKANLSGQEPCWVYWGSVNDYLREAMDGNNDDYFAQVGSIDFIAAGSPCQGFSVLQRDKSSESSLRNISMIASVAAFIDFYRPKYALLENVVAMAHRGREQLGIFPQLLCTLVGLGYQVSQHYLDAWSFGDPQRRSRLFVAIAAPGLTPMPPPTITHSHPRGTPAVALGRNLANNLRFGERRFGPTPFEYISVEQSMGDLPDVGDSHSQTCIPYPDHRTVANEAAWVREMMRHIPIYPSGQGAMRAILDQVMPGPLADRYLTSGSALKISAGSQSWSRVCGDGLTNTITTAPVASCAINGRVLHWRQHRALTIREARRAQGFDDGDVITGTSKEQWKIIGNSVSRSVALALGMALQEAWLANPPDPSISRTHQFKSSLAESAAEWDSDIRTSLESSPDVLAQLSTPINTPVETLPVTLRHSMAMVRVKQVTTTKTITETAKTHAEKPQSVVVIDLTNED
ncbi:hypothetical protein MPH_01515 [Macrophomina phaseolina MS6]|uniref:DNA (cytosine-5-)-methyltransferase n=1 Tax=Macrophomina phaseolina (strain MS6) TaxID=1126212 RepID=K2SFE0_MACPH|nr:hypothetical protein MPH_01515 [Macrophomina phaseolina MS6]